MVCFYKQSWSRKEWGGILTSEQDFVTQIWNSTGWPDFLIGWMWGSSVILVLTQTEPLQIREVEFHNIRTRLKRAGSSVMALLSVLTPVLALVLCLVMGFLFLRWRDAETTSRAPAKTKGASKTYFRPWVDQDLLDDTEIAAAGGGEHKPRKNSIFCQYCIIFAWLT